jgi:putative transposase
MDRKRYSSDLTDAQWALIAPHLPPPFDIGCPRKTDLREVCNAIFYVTREGCRWRSLPHDFGVPWQTVYEYFSQWNANGTIKAMHAALRGAVRQAAGKEPTPSAAALDSQSVKTSQKGGDRGFDAGKQIKGRKRFILVDTLGLIWLVKILTADTQERDGGRKLLECLQAIKERFPRLTIIWADGGYAGKLEEWVRATCTWALEIVRKLTGQKGFVLLPHRWQVERTNSWFGIYRRLDKDYEVKVAHSEAMLYWAMTHLMVRRLTGGQERWYGQVT